ncbi:DUF2441 domain-containing protein [Lacinutrix cladophorae]
MTTYYHINNTNCDWKKDDIIHIGKEENNYWKSFANRSLYIELKGEKHEIYKVTKAAFEEYAKLHPAPSIMKDYHFNILKTLKEATASLGDAIKLNRELIFEIIRNEFYPELPSRKNCIWLIPNHQDSLNLWFKVLNNREQIKIFKVEVDGKIHRASQDWLIGGTISINEWNNLAHNYWKGIDSGTIRDEVLFTGEMKILEKITKPTIL